MLDRKHFGQNGFTLAELMVVIILIGILVSFAYASFNMTIRDYLGLQNDSEAFYSLSQHYQRIANVLRGLTDISNATAADLTVNAYFAPQDTVVSQIRYYISNNAMLADVTPFTANPPNGTLLTTQKKTYTIINNFYSAPGVNTFTYMDASGTPLSLPISDLNTIKVIKVSLAVSSAKPNVNNQALVLQVSLRNRKTNL